MRIGEFVWDSSQSRKHTHNAHNTKYTNKNENENIIRMAYRAIAYGTKTKRREKKINKIFVQIEMVIIVYYYYSSLPYMQMYWK